MLRPARERHVFHPVRTHQRDNVELEGVRQRHLISLREHINGACGIEHDLVHESVLERADQPLIPVVDQQQGIELGLLHRERVVGGGT